MCSSATPVDPFSVALLQVARGGDPEHSGSSGSGVAVCKFPGSVSMSWLCSGSLRGSAQLTVVSYSLCLLSDTMVSK